MQKNAAGLEKKIASLSTNYLYNEAVSSLLLLLFSQTENLATKKDQIPFSIPEDLIEIQKKVYHYVTCLAELLDGDIEERKQALSDCLAVKKDLLNIYKHIYQYYAMWNLSSSLVFDETALRKYKEEQTDKNIQYSLFYQDCLHFLQAAKSESEEKHRIGQLFKCLPFQMAREKYYDILLASLRETFAEESEEAIRLSLETFLSAIAPERDKDFGKYFKDLASFLQEKKNLRPSELGDEALNEEYTDFQSVFSTLNTIEEYFDKLFNDLNSMIILFTLGYRYSELVEGELAYNDLYYSVCEMLLGERSQLEIETLLGAISSHLEIAIEAAIDQANSYSKTEQALLHQAKSFESFSEETLKILSTESYIRSLYYSDINEALFDFELDSSLPPASKEFQEQAYQEFIQSVKDYFAPLPVLYRKASMQTLLSSLPSCVTKDALLSEIQTAVETAPDFCHQALIVDKTGQLFYDYHFSVLPEEHTHTHHSHTNGQEHQHDCGCGHHTHHHHHHE